MHGSDPVIVRAEVYVSVAVEFDAEKQDDAVRVFFLQRAELLNISLRPFTRHAVALIVRSEGVAGDANDGQTVFYGLPYVSYI